MNKHASWLMFTAALVLSTGFYLSNPEDEVEAFISNTKATTRSNAQLDLGDLPKEIKYTPYKYQSSGYSPFSLKSFVVELDRYEAMEGLFAKKEEECKISGPEEHKSYFLEHYDLSTLRFVGVMFEESNKEIVALVQTPDAGIHYARKGEYIGKDNGLIGEITSADMIKPGYITITEKVKLPGGCWESRPKRLNLY